MTGYVAHYDMAPRPVTLPVVTWNENGDAMVFDRTGRLVVASGQDGFSCVAPAAPKKWKINGTFGIGAVAESEDGYPWT